MKFLFEHFPVVFGFIGTILGYFFGGFDGFLYTLLSFIFLDYLSGVLSSMVQRSISSEVGFKGLLKKGLILSMVAMGHLLDQNLLGSGETIRTAVIFFYIANEGISILENLSLMGIPIPEKLKKVLMQLSEQEREKKQMYILDVQRRLVEKGYAPGPLDGMDGPLTKEGIRQFQGDYGLEIDGLVGPITYHALFEISFLPELTEESPYSPHFNREEFRCCCQGQYCQGFPSEMNEALIKRLEALRDDLEVPIFVTSGVRCRIRNAEVGGVSFSKHLLGDAVDCYAPGFSVYELGQRAMAFGLGVIFYEEEGFCHLEI